MPLTEVHDHIFEVPNIENREVIKPIPKVEPWSRRIQREGLFWKRQARRALARLQELLRTLLRSST